MKLVLQSAPYIRKSVSVKRMMIDVLVALIPVLLFSCIQNGFRGVSVLLISIGTMVITELFCHMIMHWPKEMKLKGIFSKQGISLLKKQYTINNITAPLISSIIYALILPAGCEGYVVFIGALFGILIGKIIFGGLGSNIFNPAAIGRVFVGICFGSKLIYGQGGVDVVSSGTPLAGIKGNYDIAAALKQYSLLDLFLGQIPGSMGEVCSILILVGAIYLFVRRSADIRASLSMFISFAVITLAVCLTLFITNRINNNQIGELFLYEILSGGLLFGVVFMITDPVTSPTTKFGRIVFGTFAGAVTALIRYCGAYPEGVAFSILIANMISPMLDYLMRGKKKDYSWYQMIALIGCILLICLIVAFRVSSMMGGTI